MKFAQVTMTVRTDQSFFADALLAERTIDLVVVRYDEAMDHGYYPQSHRVDIP